MLRYLDTFERIITRALLVMMAGVALTLGYYLVRRSRRKEGVLDPESKG